MKLWTRVAALVGLLLVPLALAVASQALASRPGPPSVPDAPVVLRTGGADGGGEVAPAPRTVPTASSTPTAVPTTTPAAAVPAAPAPAVAGTPRRQAPRLVRPAPVPLRDDADDSDDRDDDADDADDATGDDDTDDDDDD